MGQVVELANGKGLNASAATYLDGRMRNQHLEMGYSKQSIWRRDG